MTWTCPHYDVPLKRFREGFLWCPVCWTTPTEEWTSNTEWPPSIQILLDDEG